jgi:hypothetical protein
MHRIDATVWWNTHVARKYDSATTGKGYKKFVPFSYSFNYTSPINRNIPKLELQINSRFLDGLMYHRAGLNWIINSDNTLSLYAQTMWRPLSYDKEYLLYENEWSSVKARPNSSVNASWKHKYDYFKGSGSYSFSLRAPFLAGNTAANFNYAYIQLNAVNYNKLAKLQVRTRLFARYGSGSNIPSESALFLAGANPEEMMEDKYTRSKGFIPQSWGGISPYETNHFQQGGGLNLRGYAGYFVADNRNGNVLIGYKGRSGIAGNLEVDFDEYIKFKPKIVSDYLHVDAYAFMDAGIIELSAVSLPQYWNISPTTEKSDLRVDAGVGLAFTIKNWWFEKAKPLTIRFDMPWFINRPPYANPQYTNFRWVMGINRSF